ncbi:MAG: GNAT family N-acetyltransferase [Candidatus Thermoplasmatota archaeon]|nr:GNAT family N-acetyltransferase [Candidatus Thermoplasmatota archaeon]
MVSDIEVRLYEESDHDRWDKFVEGSNNGTIFHLQRFLDYHEPGKFDFHHLIFEKDSNIFAVLPGQLRDGVFKSPMGASFGGFVTKDISYDKASFIVDRFMDHAGKAGMKEIYITPPLSVYYEIRTQNIDYALLHRGFEYHSNLYSSVVDLERSYDLEHFDKKARNAVRKAVKSGLKVEIKNDFDSFYPILIENKKKFNLAPTHTLDELKRIDELLPGKLKLFQVSKDDELIGGSLIFICNDRTLIDFYIAQDYSYQEYRPINLVLSEIIKWGNKNGYSYFDIGVNQDTASSNPMDLNEPLVAFKYRMGARCIMRSTFHKSMD